MFTSQDCVRRSKRTRRRRNSSSPCTGSGTSSWAEGLGPGAVASSCGDTSRDLLQPRNHEAHEARTKKKTQGSDLQYRFVFFVNLRVLRGFMVAVTSRFTVTSLQSRVDVLANP